MSTLGKKIIIIINGKGSSGKDTICKIVGKYYNVAVISEISPIKEIAKLAGWNGEKDDKSRKMLADLKAIFISYNNLPYHYAMQEIQKFSDSANEILFIHIREKEEILKIINDSPIPVYTLLVKRLDQEFIDRVYGNDADDGVENFDYDFYYVGNNINKYELEHSFMNFFNTVMLPLINK